MADFSPFIRNNTPNPAPSVYAPPSSYSDLINQGLKSGLDNTSVGLFGGATPFLSKGLDTPLSQDEFNSYGYGDLGLSYQPGMTHQSLRATLQAQRDRSMENQLLANSTTGGYLAYLGANVAGAVPDPLNLIGVGEAAEATSLGRAILRGAIANTVIAAPTVLGGAALNRVQGMPETPGEIARSFLFAGTVGGLLGAAGHGLARLGERARGLDLGMSVDQEGNVIPSKPEPYSPPPDNPIEPITPETRQKGPKTQTDEQFRNQFINPDSPRESQIITDHAGNRVLIDPNTGEILRDTRIQAPTGPISPENTALAETLQPKLRQALYQAEPIQGVKQAAPSVESTGSRAIRDAMVEQALKQNADNRVERARLPESATPPGVLQARQSPGHLGEIKETPLREFFQKALRSRTIFGLDAKSFRRGNIRVEPLLQKLSVLTHDQWNYTVDWIAQTPMLRYIAKDRGIDFPVDATKREIGDLLWTHMHENPRERPAFTYKSFPEQYQVPDAIDLNADEIAQRIRESDALDGYTRVDDIADIQAGINHVTPDNLHDELQKFRDILGLDELARQSPEVQKILQEAATIANRKQALIDSILCLLEA